MRPTRPITLFRNVALLGGLVIGVAVGGCKHVSSDPPSKPGRPIVAEPELDLENADTECAGLIAALDRYGKCPNLEDGERQWVRSAIEAAEDSFAAGKKANPDEPSLKAIALACRRATNSMRAATERCHAGKRPRMDWER